MKTCDRPIFIVGSPRSGTTLMREILDSHPNIYCPGWETGIFVHFGGMMGGDLPRVLKKYGANFPISREELISWIRDSTEQLMALFGNKAKKKRWAEKTPAHVHHIELIKEVFPNSQVIHMIRCGYDVVRSLQNMPWAPRKIKWSINTWIDSVNAGRSAGKKLKEDEYIEVRYEELITEPRIVLQRLCKFLHEEYTQQLLEFHSPVKNSWGRSLHPIQDKPVNDHPRLNFIERLLFYCRARKLMHELRYKTHLIG